MIEIAAVHTVHDPQAEGPFGLDDTDHNVPMFPRDINWEDKRCLLYTSDAADE